MSNTEMDKKAALKEILETPAWLVQYGPASAARLHSWWDGGEDVETPQITSHIDEIKLGDFVIFWVSGSGDAAGAFGWGRASGEPGEFEYPKDWNELDGPTVRRSGMEVDLDEVFQAPFVTRDTLRGHAEFAEFELFKMPNRANAFRITPEQWAVFFEFLK